MNAPSPVLDCRRDRRASQVAGIGGKPRRHGALRHQDRAGTRGLQRRAAAARPRLEARPRPRAGALGDRHPRGKAAVAVHRGAEEGDAPAGRALCRRIQFLGDRRPRRRPVLRRRTCGRTRAGLRRRPARVRAPHRLRDDGLGRGAPEEGAGRDLSRLAAADRGARRRRPQFREEGGQLGAAADRQALAFRCTRRRSHLPQSWPPRPTRPRAGSARTRSRN